MKRIAGVLLFSVILNIAGVAMDALHDYLEKQTRYWGIRDKISTANLDQLVDLKKKADAPGLSTEERTKAYTDLFHFVQKLRGFPEGRVPAAMAASNWTPGKSPLPPILKSAKPGELGNYIAHGSGKTLVILIPDIGADASVFDSFMQRNASRFKFYAVTLPGFGGSNPPTPHSKLDFGALQWWNNASNGVLNLMNKQKLDHVVLIGHQAGGYLAMKLALEHPDRVRGVIVLNGLLYAPLPGIPANASHDERIRVVNSLTPVELFPHPSPDHYFEVMHPNAAWFCKNKERQDAYLRLMTQAEPSTWWNYFAELATTDLSAEIKTLKMPMLVVPSMYDKDLPGGADSAKTALDQWNPLDHSRSSLAITVTPIEDCRAYATEDQPSKLDELVVGFTGRL